MGSIKGLFVILLLLFITVFSVFCDDSLNSRYRFPFSIGAGYQPFSALAFVQRKTTVNEIAARVRVPLPFFPVLQPFIFGGLIILDSDDREKPEILTGVLNEGVEMPDYNEQDVWDHRNYFGALGIGYAHRISKEFELGADIFFGLSQSYFPNRVVTQTGEWYPIGELNMLTGISGKLALNPSYNLSIELNPSIRYVRSFGNLHEFDGLYFGLGLSAHYRFGKDPDAPQRNIRSIQFGDVYIPSLFAAMQSFYAKNSIGSITITNTEKKAINDVQVFFYQAGFMDSPTPAKNLGTMEGGESLEVHLLASFNQEVFRVEGITPLTGEVIVNYTFDGRPVEQKQPVSYDLYDKTSITWDDDTKIAAFITPADSALRNYTSFIRQTCKDETIPLYNVNLQFAMQAYEALTEIGIMYQIDPTLPFTEVQENSMVVDSVSLPRDTLKRITGDCDDLTVLYCSLLESVGIETGFITIPGHIYAVFNTKEPSTEFKKIHPDRNMTIAVKDTLWVPVEITMIGRKGFNEAWRVGVEEWSSYEAEASKRGFYITKECQKIYRPVGLRETDLGLQYGDQEDIVAAFRKEINVLVDYVVQEYSKTAQKSGRKKDWNKLGIMYAEFLRYTKAIEAFQISLSIDPDFIIAQINMANVFYLQEKYEEALLEYTKALETVEKKYRQSKTLKMKLLINISRTEYQLAQYESAKEYYRMAENLNPEVARDYSYLASASGTSEDTGRAAEKRNLRYEVLFVEED